MPLFFKRQLSSFQSRHINDLHKKQLLSSSNKKSKKAKDQKYSEMFNQSSGMQANIFEKAPELSSSKEKFTKI